MITDTQIAYYQEFLMGRGNWDPKEFGLNIKKTELVDQFVVAFADIYRDAWSIDELLVHPREASRFCDDVRRKHGYYDLPDDVILRGIMNRRKAG